MNPEQFIRHLVEQLEEAMDDANEALLEGLTDGSEGIYEGRLELALQMHTTIKMWEHSQNGKG